MNRFRLSCVLALISSMVLVACGEKVIEVASVAISQPSAEMEIGETLSLKATVSPSNASFDGITWTSTKPKVASVSDSGLVSAISEGSTTITVMAGGKTASCSITVVKGFVAVSSISLNKTSLELIEGDTETLSAIVSPDDATDKTVSWTSSNEEVAKVKDGAITAVKEGNAVITAKAGDKSATCSVLVNPKYVAVTGVSLDQTTLKMKEGETQTLTATITPSNATDKTISWTSSNSSIAEVSSAGEVSAIAVGTATIMVTTTDGGKTAECIVTVAKYVPVPEAVDLGLPSGIKWASFNLGASKPEEYGDYYAWGETEPHYVSLDPLVWKEGYEEGYLFTNYKWCMGSSTTFTKYCPIASYGYNGYTDNKTTLELDDDAAYVALGGKWRMPTVSEINELSEKCVWEWTTINDVPGYKVTGPNTGNSIFLPAGGAIGNPAYGLIQYLGQRGSFWSSTLFRNYPYSAYDLRIGLGWSDGKPYFGYGYDDRLWGNSIRPVLGK